MMIYQGQVSPFKARIDNRLESFNQYMVTVLTLFILFFTDWIAD